MFRKLLSTEDDITLARIRLLLGVLFFVHGAQKLLGWFGGSGFSATMGMFEHGLHVPAALALLAIAAEFFGGLGLIVGFLSRVAAFGILSNMLVAIFMVHLPNGLFMNWSGTQRGEGIEYHLLAIAIAVAVIVKGAGAFSLDRFLSTAGPALDRRTTAAA